MTDLFDTKDLLTVATVDQAEINTKGYFGDNLSNLIEKVRQGRVEILIDVIPDVTYCFKSNNDLHYVFFLPEDKVKKKVKEPVYRPIKTIDELYNFLVSSVVVDDYNNTLDKVGVIFSSVFELKGKNSGYTYYRKFSHIYSTNNAIVLDDCTLEHYFNNFEIKQNGEFVPFGIEVEEQDSKSNKDKDNSLSDFMDKRIKEISEE